MTVVKADGYGHGMVASARAAREGGADWLGVATLAEALALREAGDTGPAAVLAHRARERGRSLAGVEPASTSRRTPSASSTRSPPPAGRPRPARPAQGRHRAVPRRRPLADWPDARRASAAEHEQRRPGSGHRRLVALRLQRRARPPRQRRPAAGASTRRSASPTTPACDPRCATSPTPPPRSCAPAAATTSCASASRRTASTPPRRRTTAVGLRPAMTVARAARPGQADRRRARACPTATPGPPTGTPRSASCPSGTATACPRHGSNVPRSRSTAKRRPVRGRVCMDQFVVDLDGDLPRGRRRGRAVRPR